MDGYLRLRSGQHGSQDTDRVRYTLFDSWKSEYLLRSISQLEIIRLENRTASPTTRLLPSFMLDLAPKPDIAHDKDLHVVVSKFESISHDYQSGRTLNVQVFSLTRHGLLPGNIENGLTTKSPSSLDLSSLALPTLAACRLPCFYT